MNVENIACASSAAVEHWDQIDWKRCERQVTRLQARIVKASREGRWSKVKALQRLLTCSFSGKALAVKRVTENKGKRTSGVDHVLWSTPQSKLKAIASLQRRGYRPLPLRRVYIPKSNGKLRPLSIPVMKDRAMQALYLMALEPVTETFADPNSYGFRKGRSTADAIEQCFKFLSKSDAPEWILEGDIKGCFDHISHRWLLTHVPMDTVILEKWLQCGFFENSNWSATEEGTPQGGIVSPALANWTLDGLESLLKRTFPTRRNKGPKICSKVHLVRYADDFIITGRSQSQLVNEVLPLVEQFLRERGLELSAEKTHVTHIQNGFDFLGQNIRKYGRKLLITPAQKNVQAALTKIRGIIEKNRSSTQENLINKLNPVIRGWANYHRHCVAKRAFARMDFEIWRKVWWWSRRRHPGKSATWVKNRYYHAIGERTWRFAARTNSQSPLGQPSWKRLLYAGNTPIQRHLKIKGEANPFDPRWRLYFAQRAKGSKVRQTVADDRLSIPEGLYMA
jgi:RNA-directed DNA polymerase